MNQNAFSIETLPGPRDGSGSLQNAAYATGRLCKVI